MEEHVDQTDHAETKEDPEQLKAWLEHFARVYRLASFRKARCEDLMRRPSAKRWDAAKTARMVRRLVAANTEVEQSENALDQCSHKLSQLGIEVDVVSRSGGPVSSHR